MYLKTSNDHPGLRKLERNWEVIRDEALPVGRLLMPWINRDLNPKCGWKIGGVYHHSKRMHGLIEKYCPKTCKLLDEVFADDELGLISAAISRLEPGHEIPLHTNDDPYSYRAHMGLSVPEGDCAIEIEGTKVRWIEGKFFVWRPTDMHTAYNYTDQPRTILFIDLFRPEFERSEMVDLMKRTIRDQISKKPESYGFTGHL